MRIAAITSLLVVATALAPAHGQAPPIGVTAKIGITPKKLGNVARPRGATLRGRLWFSKPAGSELLIGTGATVLLPRGMRLHGSALPRCSRSTLVSTGLRGCPTGSIVGSARHGTYADVVGPPTPQVTLVNGGRHRIWAHLVFYNPALVKQVVPIEVQARRRGRWAYQLSFRPRTPIREIAGVPVTLPPSTSFNIGTTHAGKHFLTTHRKCPRRGALDIRLEIAYEYGQVAGATSLTTRVKCR